MLDERFVDEWLDRQAQRLLEQAASGEGINPEGILLLMLKAQSQHRARQDQETRAAMQALDQRLTAEIQAVRRGLDAHFEQAARHFERLDKRCDRIASRIDRFMIGSFIMTLAASAAVIATVLYLSTH